jgi:hypothetical protein
VIYTARNLPKQQNHEIIHKPPKTQQSKPGNPNLDPIRANPETHETIKKEI